MPFPVAQAMIRMLIECDDFEDIATLKVRLGFFIFSSFFFTAKEEREREGKKDWRERQGRHEEEKEKGM